MGKSVSAFSIIEREIAVMKKLAHPNICKLLEVIDDPEANKLYLIMEYIKNGSLNSETYWKN